MRGEEDTGVATLEIPFTILENNAPAFVGSMEFAINGVNSTYMFNPYDCFSDKDGDILSFEYRMADPTIVSYAEQENGLVQFTALKPGNVRIAVTARDPKGAAASGGITVTVIGSDSGTAGEAGMSVYPNPARDYVKVSTTESGIYDVAVTSASGSTVYSSSAAISMSQPYEIDLTGVAPGSYTLILRKDGRVVGSGSFVRI